MVQVVLELSVVVVVVFAAAASVQSFVDSSCGSALFNWYQLLFGFSLLFGVGFAFGSSKCVALLALVESCVA